MMEKTKKSVGELTAEKKASASTMVENQVKKTGEALMQIKTDAEKTAVETALDTKKSAIEGFDSEVATADKAIEGVVHETKEAKPEPASLAIDPAKLAASALGGLVDVDRGVEKAVDEALQQVGSAVDTKIKEADQFLDEKREHVVKQVQGETNKATESATQGVGSILGKAKGLLNCKEAYFYIHPVPDFYYVPFHAIINQIIFSFTV
ncbi:hypothetical protein AAG570_000903 [Ranatra chinensis]|uniref:Uncharacterized protein n=1 Tax=Ranatra chinensis TaxID=642074 RepID=A0ABD0ZB44_9HEMI